MTYSHTRGNTFDMSGPHGQKDGSGNAFDFTGWDIAASVEFGAASYRRVDLVAEWLGAARTAIRLSCADTSSWPLGEARYDVLFTDPASGAKFSTPVGKFLVVSGVTGASDGA